MIELDPVKIEAFFHDPSLGRDLSIGGGEESFGTRNNNTGGCKPEFLLGEKNKGVVEEYVVEPKKSDDSPYVFGLGKHFDPWDSGLKIVVLFGPRESWSGGISIDRKGNVKQWVTSTAYENLESSKDSKNTLNIDIGCSCPGKCKTGKDCIIFYNGRSTDGREAFGSYSRLRFEYPKDKSGKGNTLSLPVYVNIRLFGNRGFKEGEYKKFLGIWTWQCKCKNEAEKKKTEIKKEN